MVWPDAQVGRCKAKENDIDKQIVVATIQTIAQPKRLEQLKEQGFSLCIVDEAHKSCAKSYVRVLRELGFMSGDSSKLLVGVTATPDRTDKLGLNNVYEKEVAAVSLLRLIRAGYLCDLRGIRIETGVDLSSAKVKRGDFVESELSEVLNTPARNKLIVESYLQHAADRKAIVFCADVAHVEAVTEAFKAAGVSAACVYGAMKPDEREKALQGYASGEIRVLVNCMLVVEGYDDPPTSAVIMARPTKSRIVYSQAVGRGTRLYPGKKDCLVIDFFDQRHDICALPGIVGKSLDEVRDGESIREAVERQEEESQVHAARIRKKREEEFDLLGKSEFSWLQVKSEWYLTVKPSIYIRLSPNNSGLYEVELLEEKKRRKLHEKPLDLGYSMGLAEDYVRKEEPHFSSRSAKWRKDPMSDKQRGFLLALGMGEKDIVGFTKGQAADAITAHTIAAG